MVPGGAAPLRRLNVNGIKPPAAAGDPVRPGQPPSAGDDAAAACFTVSPSSIAAASRTLPCRAAAVPPPPPPKPTWPTAAGRHRRGRHEPALPPLPPAVERSTPLEDGGLTSPAPVATWDQTPAVAASMPMLPDAAAATTDDASDVTRAATGGGGGNKLATLFLVAIPMFGVVVAALAWFYSSRQVSSSVCATFPPPFPSPEYLPHPDICQKAITTDICLP